MSAKPGRVVEDLNRAMHDVFEKDERIVFIGEDVLDPYGGAFRVSQGLSTRFAGRVLTTPISEAGIVGFAAGLALMGQRPIVEVMFGDFVALAFDPILNFVSKSVTMYGDRCDLSCVVRVPVGGGRGYGPTHSQSLQKHFLGIPNLDVYELSPFHDNRELLWRLTRLGRPSLLFEDKVLYTRPMFRDGIVDELFSFDFVGPDADLARVRCVECENPRCSIITTGGAALRCIEAARDLLVEAEIECQVLVPSRLYPIDADPLARAVSGSEYVFTVEEGTHGGPWGNEVAAALYGALWNELEHPITVVTSEPSVIPSAVHLEKRVLVQKETIFRSVMGRIRARDSRSEADDQ